MAKKPKFLKMLRLPVKDYVCLKEGTGARRGGEGCTLKTEGAIPSLDSLCKMHYPVFSSVHELSKRTFSKMCTV
jgi:hypothetical protein